MKPDIDAGLSASPSVGRWHRPGYSVIVVLAALIGIFLVLLLVGGWWKMASRPPIYTSLAKVMTKEPVPGSQTTDFVYWVLHTLTSQELLKRATKRTQAICPEIPPSPIDIDVFKEKDTGVVVIFATGSAGEYTQAYLESVIDELVILRMQSPMLGDLSVLARASPCLQSEKLTFGRFLRLLQEGRPSS